MTGDAKAKYLKDRYEWLKDKGFCVACGHARAAAGFFQCPDCQYKDRLRAIKRDPEGPRQGMKRLRARRAEAGLCTYCGEPARENRRLCERCARRQALLYKSRRIARIVPPGICRRVGCGKPVAEGTKHCAEHLAEMRANMAANRAKKYEDGLPPRGFDITAGPAVE